MPVAQEEPLTLRLPTEGSFPTVSMELPHLLAVKQMQNSLWIQSSFPFQLKLSDAPNPGSGIWYCQTQSSNSQMMRATYAHETGLATGDASVGLGQHPHICMRTLINCT